MSGDVFGNGMLFTRQIRLVCAFDHRHVFIDPDPDPAPSFAERQRLFATAGLDVGRLRPLAAVGRGRRDRPAGQERHALARGARGALDRRRRAGGDDARHEVIHRVLQAPVDLLWNGGIGTYVKASREANTEVGDRANDHVRINGEDVRARVVGEGGNLGFTQRGRIEYARNGGRINTDFIDNSAGVDTSDHEVNMKILLGLAVAARRAHDGGAQRAAAGVRRRRR